MLVISLSLAVDHPTMWPSINKQKNIENGTFPLGFPSQLYAFTVNFDTTVFKKFNQLILLTKIEKLAL